MHNKRGIFFSDIYYTCSILFSVLVPFLQYLTPSLTSLIFIVVDAGLKDCLCCLTMVTHVDKGASLSISLSWSEKCFDVGRGRGLSGKEENRCKL